MERGKEEGSCNLGNVYRSLENKTVLAGVVGHIAVLHDLVHVVHVLEVVGNNETHVVGQVARVVVPVWLVQPVGKSV